MRYTNPRSRNGNAQAAYLYGSSLQNTGAGPFAITTVNSNGPYPQWWAYIGAAAVVLTLPDLAVFPNKAFLFAVTNDGTGAATVDVEDASSASIVSLAVGESALVAWDEALLTYGVVGKWTVGGGALAWLTETLYAGTRRGLVFDTGGAIGSLYPLGSTLGHLGRSGQLWGVVWTNEVQSEGAPLTLLPAFGQPIIFKDGAGTSKWGVDGAIYPITDNTVDIGGPSNGVRSLYMSGGLRRGYRVVYNASTALTVNDDLVQMEPQGGSYTCTLPAITTAMLGRQYTVALGSSGLGDVTLTPTGADTIENTVLLLTGAYKNVTLVAVGPTTSDPLSHWVGLN